MPVADLDDWQTLVDDCPTIDQKPETKAAVIKFFTDAHFATPISVLTLTAADLVDGVADVLWPRTQPLHLAACRLCLSSSCQPFG